MGKMFKSIAKYQKHCGQKGEAESRRTDQALQRLCIANSIINDITNSFKDL